MAALVGALACNPFPSYDNLTGGLPGSTDGSTDGSASPSDAGADATVPFSCADGAALFCETFENGLDSARWTAHLEPAASTAQVDAVRGYRGKALHVKTAPGLAGAQVPPKASIETRLALPETFHVRFFVYLSSTPAATDGNEPILTSLVETKPPYPGMDLTVRGTTAPRTFGTNFWDTNVHLASRTPFTFDTWTCIERSVSPSVTRVSVWDKELDDLSVEQRPPRIDQAYFGISFGNQSPNPAVPAYEGWIDEIIIATGPIGCAAIAAP